MLFSATLYYTESHAMFAPSVVPLAARRVIPTECIALQTFPPKVVKSCWRRVPIVRWRRGETTVPAHLGPQAGAVSPLSAALAGRSAARLFVAPVAYSGAADPARIHNGVGTIFIWSVKSGKKLKVLDEHASFVWSMAFVPDVRNRFYLASASADTRLKLWNVDATDRYDFGTCITTVEGHKDSVYCLATFPDGLLAR